LRAQTEKHHSATHLLHAALREILGSHIAQAGSLVEHNRLRFDFSHPKAINHDELEMISAWVNDKIDMATPSNTRSMDIQSAKKSGAMALFGEKYGDEVRVVDFGDSSIELCGGTHVDNTASIGLFVITKESGVSAGVRRIEAICGKEAVQYVKNIRSELDGIRSEVKSQDALSGVIKLKEQIKTLKNELTQANSSQKSELDIKEINGIKVIIQEMPNGDIKNIIDEAKNAHEKLAIMLIQNKDDKVMIACGVKNADIKAGAWIKEIAPILGGGGGGRDDFATAGGKDASKIADALIASLEYVSTI
jgi:alanyl-tRNA synthetase